MRRPRATSEREVLGHRRAYARTKSVHRRWFKIQSSDPESRTLLFFLDARLPNTIIEGRRAVRPQGPPLAPAEHPTHTFGARLCSDTSSGSLVLRLLAWPHGAGSSTT